MTSLKLNDTELAEMRQFYQEELSKTLNKLQHIKKVLDQLGETQQRIEINIEQTRTSSESTAHSKSIDNLVEEDSKADSAEEIPAKKVKQKSGPKSFWEPLIMKRIRQLNRPLSYDELVQELMVFTKIPSEKRPNVKQAVTNVIFRLRNRDKKLDTFSMGGREKYIGLKSWFDENYKIKKEYKKLITKKSDKK